MMRYERKEKLRVLHVLPQSLPIESGSTIRSKYIVEKQKSFATPTVAVYPTYSEKQAELGNPAEIKGVKYYYCIDKSIVSKNLYNFRITSPVMTIWKMRQFKIFLQKLAVILNPDIIHAAAPFYVGIPAIKVARFFNVPFVYEVRELSDFYVLTGRHVNKYGLRVIYRKMLENYLLSNADAVVSISEKSRSEILSRGVDKSKLFTVCNGIDTDDFYPVKKKEELLRKLNLKDKFVIGFIGYLKRFEGLELIVKTVPILLETNKNIAVLIVGEGPDLDFLKKLVSRMHLEPYVIFTDHVSFYEIPNYYSIIDLFILPRIKTNLTNVISPLKCLEAMGMNTPVLGSDVGGITEIIKDGENGFIFKANSIGDLSRKISYIMKNKNKVEYICKNARNWVIENRNWDKLIVKYKNIYRKFDNFNGY